MSEERTRRRLERELRVASEKLERTQAKAIKNLPRTVAKTLAEQNPDGVSARTAPKKASEMADALLRWFAPDLPNFQRQELAVSLVPKILERAKLKDGRYYFH